jgi:hypothetical protein
MRSYFVPILAALLLALPLRAFPAEVTLEDGTFLAAFDADSGALTRLENKNTHWKIERRPELGISFRLHAPLPDRRDNFVLGQKQHAAKVQKIAPNQVLLQWTNMASEHGGLLPVTLTATVTLDHGALTFAATLQNDSNLMVETVDYPYLGDLTPPSRESHLDVAHLDYDHFDLDNIYPYFGNSLGYWGTEWPTKTFNSCQSLFCLVQSQKQGLYLEMADATQPYLVQFTFEQHPGAMSGDPPCVPKTDTIDGVPVHLDFRACHFVFAHPHSTTQFAPIVMQGYVGDWHAGVDLYKQWRATWFKPAHLADWVKDVTSWQQLQVQTPEQNSRVSYKELASYGDECAHDGVAAIQLVGWNKGGQDSGNPALDTDPRLGTWQELHDAIAHIQAEGVHMIMFGKFNWADRSTAWDQTELTKYACTDPWGQKYNKAGYLYLTPTQLAGINAHQYEIMDMASPAYRDIAAKEFGKVLALGAQGFLWDEIFQHDAVLYNFAPDHGYTPPAYIYSGDIPMEKQLRAMADQVSPDFLFAGESPDDWQRPYFPLAYTRIGLGSIPVTRYIDPQEPIMIAATGFDDREMINAALMDRYIIEYEPYNFKGRLGDFPLTLAYGRKVDALRRKYKAYLWDAEFRDTLGATVKGASSYSVFVTPAGKRAVVVTNIDMDKPATVRVKLPDASDLIVATPENPEARATSGTLHLPPRSAAVVMEK